MGNKIAPVFNFEGHNVRVVLLNNDEPWFAAVDVCQCLGILNTSRACSALMPDEKVVQPLNSLGGPQRTTVLSESGLYKLIFRSDKPAAKKFQDWVNREVLPAIRKDGMYVMGEEKVRTGELSEEEFILKAMTMLQGKVERLAEELAVTTKTS